MATLNRILIAGASIVIIVAGLQAASPIVGFVLFAGMLAICIAPLVDWLARKGIPQSLTLSATILIVIVGGLALATLLGASVARLIQTLPVYESQLMELKETVQRLLVSLHIDAAALFASEQFSPGTMLRLTANLIGGILGIIGNSLFLLILIALMLVEITRFEGKLQAGTIAESGLTARLFEVRKDVRKFVSITALIGLIIGVGNLLLLVALGVDFPLLWGVLSFLFNFIPAIGGLFALIPPFLLALLEFGWTKALIVFVGFAVINNLADNVLKPKLMKKGLDISILLIFLSLMFWSWVLGALGAILAIPLTIFIKRCVLEITDYERRTQPAYAGVTAAKAKPSKAQRPQVT